MYNGDMHTAAETTTWVCNVISPPPPRTHTTYSWRVCLFHNSVPEREWKGVRDRRLHVQRKRIKGCILLFACVRERICSLGQCLEILVHWPVSQAVSHTQQPVPQGKRRQEKTVLCSVTLFTPTHTPWGYAIGLVEKSLLGGLKSPSKLFFGGVFHRISFKWFCVASQIRGFAHLCARPWQSVVFCLYCAWFASYLWMSVCACQWGPTLQCFALGVSSSHSGPTGMTTVIKIHQQPSKNFVGLNNSHAEPKLIIRAVFGYKISPGRGWPGN